MLYIIPSGGGSASLSTFGSQGNTTINLRMSYYLELVVGVVLLAVVQLVAPLVVSLAVVPAVQLFCTVHLDFKKRPNDNLIPFVCEAIFRLEIITFLYSIASNIAHYFSAGQKHCTDPLQALHFLAYLNTWLQSVFLWHVLFLIYDRHHY